MTFSYQRRYRGPIQAVLLDWAGTTMDYGCMAPAVVFKEVQALDPADRELRRRRAYARMEQCGAHGVVDSIADLMPCLDDIAVRIARGERP